jgi:hypothetical protein
VGKTNVEMMAADMGNTTELEHELNQQQRYKLGWNTTELKHELIQQQTHELGHKLNTMESETELCKRLNMVSEEDKIFWLFYGF